MKISRIRLSDKTSRLHPRHVVPKPAQAYEPEVPVKVREWISSALASPDLVLEAQPPAQPHSGVVVDRPIRLDDGAYFEVVRPSAQRAVQLLHQLCGLLPSPPDRLPGGGDPLKLGLVASLNRPGGNVTGVTFVVAELGAKQLGLLHELQPGAVRVVVLVDPKFPLTESFV